MAISENRCRIARERAGLSISQAAKLLGVNYEVVELVEPDNGLVSMMRSAEWERRYYPEVVAQHRKIGKAAP